MDTHQQHWNDDSFLQKYSLLRAAYRQFRKRIRADEDVDAYSSLSSTCFSIAGTAVAKMKSHTRTFGGMLRLPLDLVTWAPLGMWCYLRMLAYSEEMLDRADDGFDSPYENLTADQCDVRQSILRRRGKWAEAEFCIDAGLRKESRAHTRGLLLIGKAACHEHNAVSRSSRAEQQRIAMQIESLIPKAKKENPLQAIRLYRGVADIWDRLEPGGTHIRNLRMQAAELARELGAKDQIVKL